MNKWLRGVPRCHQDMETALRKGFVILQLYWWLLVAQNTLAEIWSNAW